MLASPGKPAPSSPTAPGGPLERSLYCSIFNLGRPDYSGLPALLLALGSSSYLPPPDTKKSSCSGLQGWEAAAWLTRSWLLFHPKILLGPWLLEVMHALVLDEL